ncbi:ArsR family transcriptional regulator [Halocatena halophila]
MTTEWDTVSFVLASTYREDVLRNLVSGPSTPSQIASETDHSMSHISRALSELRDHELIELLVSEDRRKDRVYGSTEMGAEIWNTIRTENFA